MKTDELKVTTGDEYAQLAEETPEGKPYKLPSGAVWLIETADMEGLALEGAVPMSLVPAAVGSKTPKQDGADETDIEYEQDEAATDRQLVFVREMVRQHVLQPKLGYNDKGVLGVLDSKGGWHRCRRGDLSAAWAVVSGEEGSDGLNRFHNRAERRASASQSRRKALQS